MISRLRHIYIYILLIFVGLIAGISFLPPDAKNPDVDSGVFLYIGQQILNGDILYKDLWDHKGPIIYHINALGLLIGNDSVWGLYFIEFLLLLIAIIMGYLTIRNAFGRIPAIFASIIWPLSLFYINDKGGNFTEEYSLPLSYAALYLYLRSRNSSRSLIYIFFIGVMFSISFLLRPNNTGIQISIALMIFISGILTRSYYKLIKQIIAYALGSIVVLVGTVLYFQKMGALGDFFDQFIKFNTVYSATTLTDRVSAILFGLKLLSPSGLSLVAIVAWITSVFTIIDRSNLDEKQTALISVAVIGLPVEFILSSTSGLTWFHYYICWLPIFAVLTSFFAFELIRHFSCMRTNLFKREINLSYIWILAFSIAMLSPVVVKIPDRIEKFISSSRLESPVVEGVRTSLNGEKYLLMWGSEPYFNFITKMKSPTRYLHQLPFYVCGYRTEEMIDEFFDDIKRTKPLIIDTSSTDGYLAPFDKKEREKWVYMDFTGKKSKNCTFHPKMEEVYEYINSKYKLVHHIDRYGWNIYQYRDDDN